MKVSASVGAERLGRATEESAPTLIENLSKAAKKKKGITVRRNLLVLSLIVCVQAVSAQNKPGEPCAARLIRSKPSAIWIIKSETLKSCITGQTDAAVEDASIRVGRFNKLQATISVRNLSSKTIKSLEWKLEVYDEQRHTLHDTLFPSENKTIAPNKSGNASQSLSVAGDAKHVLPSFAVILVQVSKITYQDTTTYQPSVECKANETFNDAICAARKKE